MSMPVKSTVIPNSSQEPLPTNATRPPEPATKAPAASYAVGRFTKNEYPDVSTIVATMVVKGVFGLVEMYKNHKTPSQEPMTQSKIFQHIYTDYKKTISEKLTMLGGFAPAALRPFITGFKTVLINHAGNISHMEGSGVNLMSIPVNAIGTAVASLLSARLFYDGSIAKKIASSAIKMVEAGTKYPKMAPITLDPGAIFKALAAVGLSRVGAEYTKNLSIYRSKEQGEHTAESDQKKSNTMLLKMISVCGVGALLGLPVVKEKVADLVWGRSLAEKVYAEFLSVKTFTTDPKMQSFMEHIKTEAAKGKSLRIESVQQAIAVSTSLYLFGMISRTLNPADNENYISYHNKIKMENSRGK